MSKQDRSVTSKPTKPNTTVSLVLGSGGARGLAHIGIIRWLEENQYCIKSISGSSIGALIGGAYAVGKLDELEGWFKQLNKTEIIGITDIAWDRSGLIKGDKLFSKLKELIGDPDIESLSIPFTAVATDIENEKEIWLQKGSLLEAIRASTALPMIFTPFHKQGLTLVDGGVLNPVPIAPTFSEHNDLIIAVNLGGKPRPNSSKNTPPPEKASWLENLSEQISRLKKRLFPEEDTLTPFNWDVYDISNKAFDSMQSTIARQKLAAYAPDIVIEISRDACGMLEFTCVEEMITLGYQTAKSTLDKQSNQPQ